MEPAISPLLFAVLLFGGMLILLEIGRRLSIRRRSEESEGERGSLGTIEGAMFALFGLVVAFTFSGAASRFNEKRILIAEEANAIETAYLRLQLLSPEARLELQELFRQYVDSRLETYRKLPNMEAAKPRWPDLRSSRRRFGQKQSSLRGFQILIQTRARYCCLR